MTDTAVPEEHSDDHSDGPNDIGFSPRDHIMMSFPTPIVAYGWDDVDDLNAELKTLVLDGEKAEESVERSNVGGWHSDLAWFERSEPAIAELRKRIEKMAINVTEFFLDRAPEGGMVRFKLEGWANLLRQGGYNNVHNHGNSHWSGVYYVTDNPQIPDHPLSGKLEFLDPRSAATMLALEEFSIYGRQLFDPQAGAMILFPSWLQHQVHPYFGTDARISIAFNLFLLIESADDQ